MSKNWDIYIKDEGDFATCVFFGRALELIQADNIELHSGCKLDIVPDQAIKILTWAITHQLKVESEVPMIIASKPNKKSQDGKITVMKYPEILKTKYREGEI